ncbi:C1QL [Mytilus edulis]|uniref:C1QL n=1 Tax=Mytilus edulis TaxID=6550 RepID=A0A8S3PPK4_MYTED|nr:C1QL [Mytilus edulis]
MTVICNIVCAAICLTVSTTFVHANCSPKIEHDLFKDLIGMMKKIRGSGYNGDIPAFSASLSKSQNLGSNTNVLFDKVWTNVGNGYSTQTGVFTVPTGGLYQISCTVVGASGKTLRVHLWKNEQKTVGLYPNLANFNSATLNMVLDLKEGDRVYIRHGNSQSELVYNEPGTDSSMFSGYLISK